MENVLLSNEDKTTPPAASAEAFCKKFRRDDIVIVFYFEILELGNWEKYNFKISQLPFSQFLIISSVFISGRIIDLYFFDLCRQPDLHIIRSTVSPAIIGNGCDLSLLYLNSIASFVCTC